MVGRTTFVSRYISLLHDIQCNNHITGDSRTLCNKCIRTKQKKYWTGAYRNCVCSIHLTYFHSTAKYFFNQTQSHGTMCMYTVHYCMNKRNGSKYSRPNITNLLVDSVSSPLHHMVGQIKHENKTVNIVASQRQYITCM